MYFICCLYLYLYSNLVTSQHWWIHQDNPTVILQKINIISLLFFFFCTMLEPPQCGGNSSASATYYRGLVVSCQIRFKLHQESWFKTAEHFCAQWSQFVGNSLQKLHSSVSTKGHWWSWNAIWFKFWNAPRVWSKNKRFIKQGSMQSTASLQHELFIAQCAVLTHRILPLVTSFFFVIILGSIIHCSMIYNEALSLSTVTKIYKKKR